MAWVLLAVTAVLAVLVGVLALRLQRLERRLAAGSPSSDVKVLSDQPDHSTFTTLDEKPAQYVITRLGEDVGPEQPDEAALEGEVLPGGQFADLLLRESAVQVGSLVAGLRRALSPEVRNRIRFEMRREVKRSRKQRRQDTKLAYREWAARQRAAMAGDEAAQTPAEGRAA